MGDVESGHFGLEMMRERAAAVGAHLTVESTPLAGTRVVVKVPAQPGRPAEATV